ncbi:MAG: ATP-binding protein [Actinomycetota bacterium]|nr:ATP-binding protein [Actinomycetota bacterium]
MAVDRITELRLTSFKSYRDAALPLAPLTVLIGRNGGGKSNALDALEVLSRLARVGEIRDALDGARRDAGPVRGGIEGCPPIGSDTFELGVSIARAAGEVRLDVEIQVRPQVQIVRESLTADVDGKRRVLLETTAPDPHRADIEAKVWNKRSGRNPHHMFRATHLLTAQLPLRLGGQTVAERHVLEAAEVALAVLRGVFHLDPVPQLMRQYVPEQDVVLRRNGENLSATIARLRHDDKARFAELVEVIKDLPEHEVRALEVGRGEFGDVMLALSEVKDGRPVTVPARQMSDGMLRMIAVVTALLAGGPGVAIEGPGSGAPSLTLVLEELENGLHPTQAARVLGLVKSASEQQGFQVVLTTHGPALLNALDGDDHPGVLVIGRERDGRTQATRLVDLPGYLAMMASGRLGDLVTAGRLPAPGDPEQVDSAELDRLLGIA